MHQQNRDTWESNICKVVPFLNQKQSNRATLDPKHKAVPFVYKTKASRILSTKQRSPVTSDTNNTKIVTVSNQNSSVKWMQFVFWTRRVIRQKWSTTQFRSRGGSWSALNHQKRNASNSSYTLRDETRYHKGSALATATLQRSVKSRKHACEWTKTYNVNQGLQNATLGSGVTLKNNNAGRGVVQVVQKRLLS
jgi:hypothetical protein